MTGDDVTLGLAFLAGLLSFISPCVLPLLPAYVSYLGARATRQVSGELALVGSASGGMTSSVVTVNNRVGQFIHGLFFVLGFTLVFVGFGVAVNAGINLLSISSYDLQSRLTQIGGVIVILFGLHVMGVTGWLIRRLRAIFDTPNADDIGRAIVRGLDRLSSILYADTRRPINPRNPYGYAGSAVMGAVFAAGWTPCVGPIYGFILNMVIGGTLARGTVLLTAYSLGLGLPFLLMTFAVDPARGLIRRIQRHMRLIEVVSGAFLIIMGYLLASNELTLLTARSAWLSNVSYNLEECGTGLFDNQVPIGDFGKCLQLGPNYQALPPVTAAQQAGG
ncbi:MAG: cytochrome c biogenesis CcdA family protein [Aggregatilineales bacterium]